MFFDSALFDRNMIKYTNKIVDSLKSQQFYKLKEDDSNIYLDVKIPGFEEDEISIEYIDDYLEIKASSKDEDLIDFKQSWVFNISVDESNISAKLKNGILKVVVPKFKNTTKQSAIKIKINK